MAETLRGIQHKYSPSGFPIQAPYTQTGRNIVQLDCMDYDTDTVRLMIQSKILKYLKEREEFCKFNPHYLVAISKDIDDRLFKAAQSQAEYMDFKTVELRLNAMLSSGAFCNSRYTFDSSAPLSTLQQLRMEVPDLSTQQDRAFHGSIKLPLPSRDLSTHNVFHTCTANGRHNVAMNFACSSADKTKRNPESLAHSIATPCVPALSKCRPDFGGVVGISGRVHNVYTKDHFPRDCHQVDSPLPSTSWNSSSLSAVCDRTTPSSIMRMSSMGSSSTENGHKLSTSTTGHDMYEWSHPIEQSDRSNITTGDYDLLYLPDQSKMSLDTRIERRFDGCTQKTRQLVQVPDHNRFGEKCPNLSMRLIRGQSCFVNDSDASGSGRERAVRAEQIRNSTVSKPTSMSIESSGKHHPAKRLKVDSTSLLHIKGKEFPKEQQPLRSEPHLSSETVESKSTGLLTKSPSGSSLGENNTSSNISLGPTSEDLNKREIVRSSNTVTQCYENDDIEMKESKLNLSDQTSTGSSLSIRKKRVASVLYALTADELRDHIRSLNQHSCQSTLMMEEPQLVEGLPDQNKCSLCRKDRLLFEPPPRFCALCLKIINSMGSYYVEVNTGDEKNSICSRCHHHSSAKAKYEKRYNYAETDAEAEWWVECDTCKTWQHQICALFDPKLEEAEYACAKCLLKEKDMGDTTSLVSCTVLGALELPRTKLSDHIEHRLCTQLEQERLQRANASGKGVEEVPEVKGLTVRVVSSAAKVLQVQPRFHDFFKGKYPSEFPYKSKAILLFQKNEGVDVCLFAMYVQEYGSTSPIPNRRHIYLAYIDSVKYFRPEIKSATGEALRTFVYHQILVGYLDYCKKLGFVSCSLWACPSTKRDDYVLYCHPTTQKMPKSDKLRSWYQNLIKKAVKEGVVVESNSINDFYFQTSGRKANISAACLPYCENDFWPGEAERILEKNDDGNSLKNGTQVGRLLRVAKRDYWKGNLKDILLVHKIGEKMRPMKEDFIMLCLWQFCKHCRQPIVSGKSWVCTSCKNFSLCDQCQAEELNIPQKDRHPFSAKQKHAFQRVEEEPLPETDDGDPTMGSKYADSRIDFLKHCQDNLYQFDTLRRAKHSTMMILHHIHDSACSACHHAMDQRLAWRCPVCFGCSFCNSCYKQSGKKLHIHKLSQANNRNIFQNYTLQDYLEGMVHASKCFSDPHNCNFKLCVELKRLFFHGVQCKIRNRGGCRNCIFMWKLIRIHSKGCNDNEDCKVPRCRDVREFMAGTSKLTGPCAADGHRIGN